MTRKSDETLATEYAKNAENCGCIDCAKDIFLAGMAAKAEQAKELMMALAEIRNLSILWTRGEAEIRLREMHHLAAKALAAYRGSP